jgi:hypothetical protein
MPATVIPGTTRNSTQQQDNSKYYQQYDGIKDIFNNHLNLIL